MKGWLTGLTVIALGINMILFSKNDMHGLSQLFRFSSEKSRRLLCTVWGSILIFIGILILIIQDI